MLDMRRIQISFLLCLVVSFAFSLFAQDTKELILLQTSDVHSRIEPVNQKGDRNYNEGGFVRRATFLEQFRKEHDNVLLFDCGDISQGTPYYNMFQGEVEIKLMNEMGYDAMTIGNHEFDFGRAFAHLYERPENIFEHGWRRSGCHAHGEEWCACRPS